MHPLDLDLPIHYQNLHVPHVSVVPGESLWPALARLREELKFLQSYLTGVFLVIFDLWCGWLPPRLSLSWQMPSDSRGAAVSPCGWPALCWLPVTARQELALRSRAGSETPTALPFAQTAWDSLVLVSMSQRTLKRCNKASTSVTAIHEKALKSEGVSRLVLSNSFWPHRL